MFSLTARNSLLRAKGSHDEHRVTFVELFFDLVFVFAVTQIAHHLLEHLNLKGLIETLLLTMAMWWVWIYTSWVANWLDPQKTPVRLMLLGLMLAGLILTASIPGAFGERGLAFALAYVVMQLGRSLFMLWALCRHNNVNFRNFIRITSWLTLSAIFWIAGGLEEGNTRFLFWLIALGIEYAGPAASFWTPGFGRSRADEWDVSGEHLAERCGLFIIIALGESILVAGKIFADMPMTPASFAAFFTTFVGTVAMWWIYFNITGERAGRRFAEAQNTGRIARLGYTYIHILLVAGLVVTAVADDIILAHPMERVSLSQALVILGGPLVYLIGNVLFQRAVVKSLSYAHLVGIALTILSFAFYSHASAMQLGILSTACLVLVAVWETKRQGKKKRLQ